MKKSLKKKKEIEKIVPPSMKKPVKDGIQIGGIPLDRGRIYFN